MAYQIHSIIAYKLVSPFTLELVFNDGAKKTIDFLPILHGEMYGPLADLSFFQKVILDKEAHTITWPNGADFDPAVLYNWEDCVEELTERARNW